MTRKVCILIVTFVLLAFGASNHQSENGWLRIINRLYSSTGSNFMRPEEVQDSLEQVLKAYAQVKEKDPADESEEKLLEEVGELWAASRDVGLNCDLASFSRFRALRRKHLLHYMQVYPYLRHFNLEHYSICEPKLLQDLRDGVARLLPETKYDLDLLWNEIAKTSSLSMMDFNSFLTSKDNFRDSLLRFMDLKVGHAELNSDAILKDAANGRMQYEQKFHVIINDLCQIVSREIGTTIDVFNTLMFDNKVGEQMDDFTRQWIIYGRVCKRILSKLNKSIELTYETLVSRNIMLSENNNRRVVFS